MKSTLILAAGLAFAALTANAQTLRFATWDSNESLEIQKSIAAMFEAAHPGVTVQVEAYGDGDLSEVINVDQRVNGGTWNVLGTFPLDVGSGPTITIGCFDSGGWIGADAVRLVESPIGGPG